MVSCFYSGKEFLDPNTILFQKWWTQLCEEDGATLDWSIWPRNQTNQCDLNCAQPRHGHMKCDIYSAILEEIDIYFHLHKSVTACLLNISKPLLVTTIGEKCSSKRSSSSSLLLKVVIIVILGMGQTCYAGRPRWALDHAVATVALEHDLTAILDFPEIFHRIIFSHL